MIVLYFILSLLLVGLDQWVKLEIVSAIPLGESHVVIPNLLSLTYLQNTGAAWSIFEGKIGFFAIITVVAVAAILFLMMKNRQGHFLLLVGFSFILAGAIGNFIDRVRLGYVVDMFQLDFIQFPIFNVADMSLCIGVLCLFIYTIFEERLKGSKHAK
jgi:signal peptidase II